MMLKLEFFPRVLSKIVDIFSVQFFGRQHILTTVYHAFKTEQHAGLETNILAH